MPKTESFDPEPPDLLTGRRAIADFVGVSEAAVRRLMREGDLPVIETAGELRMSRGTYWEMIDAREKAALDEKMDEE